MTRDMSRLRAYNYLDSDKDKIDFPPGVSEEEKRKIRYKVALGEKHREHGPIPELPDTEGFELKITGDTGPKYKLTRGEGELEKEQNSESVSASEKVFSEGDDRGSKNDLISKGHF